MSEKNTSNKYMTKMTSDFFPVEIIIEQPLSKFKWIIAIFKLP